jgi:phosphatidylserine/phosphatidylglycerophosphate/cardiolipin synthase-like enzyme
MLNMFTLIAGVISVYFSPLGGCEHAITELIDGARTSVHIEAYQYSNAQVQLALLRARQRNIEVVAVFDGKHPPSAANIAALKAAGAVVFGDKMHSIAHSKVIIVDHFAVETGSFNYSRAAEASNHENVIIVRDTTVASRYESDFAEHRAHSVPL